MMVAWSEAFGALSKAAALLGLSEPFRRIVEAATAADPKLLPPPPESPDETIDAEAREKLAKKFPKG